MANALVTGATSGIGRAIALGLHDAGHRVTAVGRDPAALAELAARGLVPLAADVTADTGALADTDPEILVNNAGLMPPLGNFADLDPSEIAPAIALNLTAALTVTRAVLPAMRARGKGHIFFTGSTAGHAPFANLALYAATKAAIGGFARSLRLDLAPLGIRVTEIVAGRVETSLYRDRLPLETRAAMYAGGGAVQPQDVAAMVLAVLALPQNVDVARFDILPMQSPTATGTKG